MADGKTHTKVSRRVALVGAVGVFIAFANAVPALLFLFGGRASVYLTPDLDVHGGRKIHAYYLLKKRSPMMARVYNAYWKPYAVLVPHRSWVSHTPVISTIIRFVYMFWWTLPLFIIYAMNGGYAGDLAYGVLWWFAGLMVGDIFHIVYDSKFMRFILNIGKKKKSGCLGKLARGLIFRR